MSFRISTLPTLQAYYILAVVLGGTLGHYIFGGTMNADAALRGDGVDKGMACH